jgi:hypothetical protein
MGDVENEVKGNADERIEAKAYEVFKSMVLAYGNTSDKNLEEKDPILLKYNRLRPQHLGGINTIETFKTYKPIILNSVITSHYNVVPFGFNSE